MFWRLLIFVILVKQISTEYISWYHLQQLEETIQEATHVTGITQILDTSPWDAIQMAPVSKFCTTAQHNTARVHESGVRWELNIFRSGELL